MLFRATPAGGPAGWPRRRASVTWLKVAAMAVAGVVLVLIGNTNRGVAFAVRGLPWVVLVVLVGAGGLDASCSAAPGSAGTSTRSAATPRRPGGPGST